MKKLSSYLTIFLLTVFLNFKIYCQIVNKDDHSTARNLAQSMVDLLMTLIVVVKYTTDATMQLKCTAALLKYLTIIIIMMLVY